MKPLECDIIQPIVDTLSIAKEWTACCGYHDLNYLIQDIPRSLADAALETCMAAAPVWYAPIVAPVVGVVLWLFGWIAWNKSKRKNHNG